MQVEYINILKHGAHINISKKFSQVKPEIWDIYFGIFFFSLLNMASEKQNNLNKFISFYIYEQ